MAIVLLNEDEDLTNEDVEFDFNCDDNRDGGGDSVVVAAAAAAEAETTGIVLP